MVSGVSLPVVNRVDGTTKLHTAGHITVGGRNAVQKHYAATGYTLWGKLKLSYTVRGEITRCQSD